ncbi:MAG: GntR family transcriptional regulator [Caulobacteraceae bacterium]|nr:GntR family transcriptional regulator [Caulobacteraceae bacterium]
MPALSSRLKDLHASPVREMLTVALRPEVISFAGGLPAEDSFADLDLPSPSRSLLQYGPTEGEPALRALISEELRALGLDAPAERVLVLSGSQQGIDLVAKLAIDEGAGVAVEAPTYLAALQVFRFFGARFETLDPAAPGLAWGQGASPRLAYVTPTFSNPTGACWGAEDREALAHACEHHGVVLFEDDPYRDLAYEPCERRPIASRMASGSWIYQGSFSKTAAPGLRLGFLAASADLFPYLARLKQAADLHTNRLSQGLALSILTAPGRAARMAQLIDRYRKRRDQFDVALRRHLGGLADWRIPPGGLFFWVKLRGGIDSQALLAQAIARNVLFTPGAHFFAGPRTGSAMRLNFSLAEPEAAERGLAVLGDLLREARGGCLSTGSVVAEGV